MTVNELLQVMVASKRVIVKDGDEVLYSGFNALAEPQNDWQQAEVKSIAFVPDIKHKQWKERGLLEPLNKEETPAYSFSDLELRLYYVIEVQNGTKENITQ